MRRTLITLSLAALFAAAGCSTGSDTGSASPGASTAPQASGSPAESAPASSGTAFDPMSVSGDLTLQGWSAGAVEAPILDKVLEDFQAKYPNIKVKFEPIAGDYAAAMAAKFSSQDVPDVFYVDSGPARPGSTTASSSRSTTTSPSPASTPARSSRATSTRSRAPTASVRPAQGRQHDRHGLQHRHLTAGVTAPPTTWTSWSPPATGSRARPASTHRCA